LKVMVKRGPKGGKLRLITRRKVEDIHVATLEVLEQVGMRTTSKKILKVFLDAGADVESKTKTIKIPQHLVKEALKKAPKQIILCGRNPENDVLLEDNRVYFGMGGTPVPYIRDIETGEFRRPKKKDMEDASRLGDALPNISFLMSIAGAFDVPYEVEYLHEWDALFNNTEKPILYSCPDEYPAKKLLEMAAAVAGGMDELRRRPILCLYSETISPLTFPTQNENIIEFAKAGIPVALGPAPMIGVTGPGTVVGSTVVSNAENLAAITLSQLVGPGTPIIYAPWANVMDPITTRVAYAAPEFTLNAVLNAQMAEYYELPRWGFAGCSDSKLPDAQAGAEVMMMSLMNALAGINLLHDCGYLAGGSVGSMEMAVICDEVLGMVSRILRGVEVNDETLAVDVIREIGPEGNFLSHRHTLKLIEKELHMPRLFDRTSEVTWAKAGKKEIREVAREKVKKILKEHHPEPLPRNVQQELAEIVKQAEKELVKN